MPVGWFLVPYVRDAVGVGRVLAGMDTVAGLARISYSEVLGNQAVLKASGPDVVLSTIAALPGVRRLPLTRLNDRLSQLTPTQKTALLDELLAAGYTSTEVNRRFVDIDRESFGDFLAFLARRRRRPRYDSVTDTIFVDGPVQTCRPITDVDGSI